MANVTELAARLSKAVADRTAIEQLSDETPDLDLATGYAVQRALREQAGPLAGWKLGITSPAKQAQVGVKDPVYGFLAAGHALDLGAPLKTGELIQPRAEPEIVFTMGRDLAGIYHLLEDRGEIRARIRSGYYVAPQAPSSPQKAIESLIAGCELEQAALHAPGHPKTGLGVSSVAFGLGVAEENQHRIADEFQDLATLLRDRVAHRAEIAVEKVDQRVARQCFRQIGEATEVTEPDHRPDGLAGTALDLTFEHAPARLPSDIGIEQCARGAAQRLYLEIECDRGDHCLEQRKLVAVETAATRGGQ